MLLRYACEVAGGLDSVAVNCVDRTGLAVEVCDAYAEPTGRLLRRLEPGAAGDLAHREGLARRLRQLRPVISATDDIIDWVERTTALPVRVVGKGERASDEVWRR